MALLHLCEYFQTIFIVGYKELYKYISAMIYTNRSEGSVVIFQSIQEKKSQKRCMDANCRHFRKQLFQTTMDSEPEPVTQAGKYRWQQIKVQFSIINKYQTRIFYILVQVLTDLNTWFPKCYCQISDFIVVEIIIATGLIQRLKSSNYYVCLCNYEQE